MNKIIFKVLLVSFFLGLLVAIFYLADLSHYISLAGFNRYNAFLLIYEAEYPLKFVGYFSILYVILLAFFMPGTVILDILAGFIFGYELGFAIVIICYTVGIMVNYYLVYNMKKLLWHDKLNKYHTIFDNSNRFYLFLSLLKLRLIPVLPFWVVNVLALMFKINFVLFMAATIIGVIPISFAYLLIGEGIYDEFANNQKSSLSYMVFFDAKIWIPLLVVIVITVLSFIVKHLNKKINCPDVES